jgi:hypothetical protein
MRFILILLLFSSLAISQSTQPSRPVRAQHMVYDTQRKQILLLSISPASGREELWSWNGKDWKPSSTPGPPARESGGAVYDTRRNRIVLFGGIGIKSQSERLGDTWEWNGSRWEQQTAALGIGTLDHHYMAFDEARGRTVVYGGQLMDRSWATDTYEWDGMNWTTITTPGPGGRVHFAMVYDTRHKRVLMFGGFDQDYKTHNDLWAWDGKTWQKLSEGGPPPRSHHAMAFHEETGSIVLFGGLRSATSKEALNDTWLWDGQQWKEIKTMDGPPRRSGHVMAYDAASRKTVLYGGASWEGQVSTRYQDTWEWDGTGWSLVAR